MELSVIDIFKILYKRLWVLVLSMFVALSLTAVVTRFFIAPSYTASCQMYVNPGQEDQSQDGTFTELQYAQKLVNSYLIILQNRVFLDEVAAKSSLGYTAAQIREMISLSSINNTEFFEVTVVAPSAQAAYTLVSKIAELAPAEITRIRETDSVKIVSPATMPESPSGPNLFKNTLIGGIIGLLLAASAAVLVDVLDTRVRSEEDLSKHYELPVLGCIPKYED